MAAKARVGFPAQAREITRVNRGLRRPVVGETSKASRSTGRHINESGRVNQKNTFD